MVAEATAVVVEAVVVVAAVVVLVMLARVAVVVATAVAAVVAVAGVVRLVVTAAVVVGSEVVATVVVVAAVGSPLLLVVAVRAGGRCACPRRVSITYRRHGCMLSARFPRLPLFPLVASPGCDEDSSSSLFLLALRSFLDHSPLSTSTVTIPGPLRF